MSVEYTINIPRTKSPMTATLTSNGKQLSADDFERVCRENPEMQIEQTAAGEIIIMPPTGGITGNRNFLINGEFYTWVLKNKHRGLGFDSSTVFVLPNGAKRSPDLSWIELKRWNALTPEQQEGFAPICPDFVMELRSRSDTLKSLQEKMIEYLENGAQLGWLIDPTKRKFHVYRSLTEIEILDAPDTVSGEPLLPKFNLKLQDFWK